MDEVTLGAAILAAISGGIGLLRRDAKNRRDAYEDARKDLGDCKKLNEAMQARVEANESEITSLRAGLADCQMHHAVNEAKLGTATQTIEALMEREAATSEKLVEVIETVRKLKSLPPGSTNQEGT